MELPESLRLDHSRNIWDGHGHVQGHASENGLRRMAPNGAEQDERGCGFIFMERQFALGAFSCTMENGN